MKAPRHQGTKYKAVPIPSGLVARGNRKESGVSREANQQFLVRLRSILKCTHGGIVIQGGPCWCRSESRKDSNKSS